MAGEREQRFAGHGAHNAAKSEVRAAVRQTWKVSRHLAEMPEDSSARGGLLQKVMRALRIHP